MNKWILFFLQWIAKKQKKNKKQKNCPFVFWENLRIANLLFGFIWPLPCSLFVICLTTPTPVRQSSAEWVSEWNWASSVPTRALSSYRRYLWLGLKLVKFLVKSLQSRLASSPMSTIVWVLVKNLSSWALVIMSGSSLERLLLTHLWPFCHHRRRSRRRGSVGSAHRPS